jgi:hypothetical protein
MEEVPTVVRTPHTFRMIGSIRMGAATTKEPARQPRGQEEVSYPTTEVWENLL